MSDGDARVDDLAAGLDQLRDELVARYGWTHVELEFERVGPTRVRGTGTVAVATLAATIRARLTTRLEPGVELELELRPMPVLAWHALPAALPEGSLALWAEHPSRAPRRSLATELDASDGPVGRLATAGSATLLRARDGTVGWSLAPLGAAMDSVDSPTLPEPRVPACDPGPAVCAAANAYLGVPYLLGGTSARRIDCSGLVARAYAIALGVVVPRNSNDQLAITGGEPIERAHGDPGDLLFLRSRALGRTHVGIATGRGTVIHASRSRNSVLEEPVSEFESDAQWLRRVAWPEIVAWSRTQAGRRHLELSELPARAR
jgi:cell wall-associated NlpC family hydrolase